MNLIDLISKHPVPVTRFQRPYVIAEAGVNHEGSMDIARRLIDEAALGGADQTDAVMAGAGKGAFAVAEKLAFDQVLRQAGAVDGDERP